MNKAGTLYIVATPIGNRDDITLRALEILKSVDLIACEDTRHTGQLLAHYEIKKPLVSYFQHSQLSKVELIIDELKNGKDIALVTDAGTPGISDPGQALIWKIRELSSINDQLSSKVIPIPGPSALAAIASVSGMIEKEFYFAGFLPKKKGRQTKFKQLSNLDVPVIIYESANRLERTLEDIKTYFSPDSEVFIGREMTKMFEEYWGGNIEEIIADLKNHQLKGEVALVVKGNKGK
ncbi:MAG: 16S rRNA (cytidine(1402)-2'-O)-methyltransferase [bacterium]|nr:16S rRNA (cytidine(1402)-2'-O)-methyltransferase [bacterium]